MRGRGGEGKGGRRGGRRGRGGGGGGGGGNLRQGVPGSSSSERSPATGRFSRILVTPVSLIAISSYRQSAELQKHC